MGCAAGVVQRETPGRTHAHAALRGRVFEKAPPLRDPRVQHLRFESGHPRDSLSLVKFLKK